MTTSAKRLSDFLAALCTAVRFLTIVPVSWRAADDSDRFGKSLAFFPVVGLLIGTLGAGGAYGALHLFPQPVVAVFSLLYLAGISGFLHLDGLCDSADGLLSSRPKEQCLAIMRDSRAGAMGVVMVAGVLLLKYAALSSLEPAKLCLAIIFMPLAGRCAILSAMWLLPYARREGGLGLLFYSASSRSAAVMALVLLVVLLAVLAPSQLWLVLLAFFTVNLLFGRWCKARLGGATGDTLGAVCELTEAMTAVAFTGSLSLF